MQALDSRSHRARLEPTFALASIALHAGLLYVIGRAAWITPPPRLETMAIVWLEQPLLATVPPPLERVELPPDIEPLPRPPRPAREAPRVRQPAAPEPEPSQRPRQAPRAPPEAILEPSAAPPLEGAPAASEPQTPAAAPVADFETARQKAVARVIEQQAREREYRSFSLEDLGEVPPPPAEPGAEQDIFSASGSSGGRPSLLRPSRARTRVGRALAEICHDLTGGIGVFGLFSLCAEQGERADFFGHLRPAYMDKLPVCTEQELSDAQLAAARITDPSTIDRIVVKCRLVDRDEALAVPE